MGQTTDELRNRIENQRDQFEDNINEIEGRVKHATDWRAQFDERPMALIAAAFGGGALLGMLLGGGSDDSHQGQQRRMYQAQTRQNGGTMGWITGSQGPHRGTDAGKNKAAEQLDTIRGALMGIGAQKLEDFLKGSVSGFDQELESVQGKKDEQRGGQQSELHSGSATQRQEIRAGVSTQGRDIPPVS
jgi:hypothetical protein